MDTYGRTTFWNQCSTVRPIVSRVPVNSRQKATHKDLGPYRYGGHRFPWTFASCRPGGPMTLRGSNGGFPGAWESGGRLFSRRNALQRDSTAFRPWFGVGLSFTGRYWSCVSMERTEVEMVPKTQKKSRETSIELWTEIERRTS